MKPSKLLTTRLFIAALFFCQMLYAEPVDYVSTLVGTLSKHSLSTGNTYPAIALPWGMNFWTPQTGKMGDGWQYVYTADGITFNVDNDFTRNMIGAWQKGIQSGALSQSTFVDNAGGRNGFKAGQIAMCYEAAGRWMEAVATIGAENLALIPIPGDFGGTVCFGCQMVIPKASKNPGLVCQFSKEAIYGEYCQTNAFTTYGKMSVIQKHFDAALEATPLGKGIADPMSKAKPMITHEESQKWLEGLDQIFQKGLVSTTTTPADMVKQILDLSASIRK